MRLVFTPINDDLAFLLLLLRIFTTPEGISTSIQFRFRASDLLIPESTKKRIKVLSLGVLQTFKSDSIPQEKAPSFSSAQHEAFLCLWVLRYNLLPLSKKRRKALVPLA